MRKEKDFEQYLENIKKIAAEEGYDSLDETYVEHLKCRYLGQDVIIGTGVRITLRELKNTDLEPICAFTDTNDEAVLGAFLKESQKESEAYLKTYIEHMYPMYDYGIWAVVRNSDQKLIGLCGLGNPTVDGEECIDLGYYICPECRGLGFATEAVELALDYAKDYLELSSTCAVIKGENKISERVLEKFGFVLVKMREECGQKLCVYQKELDAGNY